MNVPTRTQPPTAPGFSERDMRDPAALGELLLRLSNGAPLSETYDRDASLLARVPSWEGDGLMSNDPAKHHSRTPDTDPRTRRFGVRRKTNAAPSVYLAGPITGLTYDDGQDWREYAKAWLDAEGIDGYSPLRAKQHLRELGVLDNAGTPDSAYIGLNALSEPQGITTRDRFDCTGRDLVLVNFVGAKTVSIGTCIELGWADGARVPLVVAMEDDNLHRHAMVNQVSGFIVPTLEEALVVAKAVLLP